MAKRQAKKTKRKLSDCLEDLLLLPVSDEEQIDFLKGLGIAKDKADNNMLLAARLVEKASQGDISAMKEIRAIKTEEQNTNRGILNDILEAVKRVE